MEFEKETSMSDQHIEKLERLVDELMKDSPEEGLVKNYMKDTGLEYTADPIERINLVLRALHFEEPTKG